MGAVRLVAVLVMVGALVAACDEPDKYGEGLPKPTPGGPTESTRLGETTTSTTAPSTTTTRGPSTTTTRPTTTTTTRPSTTRPAVRALEITINGDSSGKPQFAPSTGTTCRGGIVKFVNTDTVPRSVESAKAGAFDTGPIAPGESAQFKADFPVGRYNYTDGTRPYAQGILEVGSC